MTKELNFYSMYTFSTSLISPPHRNTLLNTKVLNFKVSQKKL